MEPDGSHPFPRSDEFMHTVASNSAVEASHASGDGQSPPPRECELLAFRSSVTLLDMKLAMSLVIGERGVRVSLRCGAASEPEKRLS
jgi:hypothetical protein